MTPTTKLSRSYKQPDGFSTSLQLERCFWDVLERVRAARKCKWSELLGELYTEYCCDDEAANFASYVRCWCLENRTED